MTRTLPRRAPASLAACLALLALAACHHTDTRAEQARVAQTFDAWKQAVLDHHAGQSTIYIRRNADDYLASIKTPPASGAAASPHPAVDLYLRRALATKVPPDLRANLTLATLLQRISDRNLVNPRDVSALTLGPVDVEGSKASATIYYNGVVTPVSLAFLKEDGAWKIDILSILPWTETLLTLDRLVTRKSEDEQVDQLVAKLPSL
jgi:hypothetical protein